MEHRLSEDYNDLPSPSREDCGWAFQLDSTVLDFKDEE
jgi:hypothetical protein